MSTKHTPGPWMWDSDPIKGDPLNRVRFRVVARGKTVTQCYYSSSDEQAEHDARVIAAAPDLLEALNDLIEAADSMRGTYTFEQGKTPEHEDHHGHEKWAEEFLQERADAARAAIAKATGQKGGA